MSAESDDPKPNRDAARARKSKASRLSDGWVRLDMLVPTVAHRRFLQNVAKALPPQINEGQSDRLDERLQGLMGGIEEKHQDLLTRAAEILKSGNEAAIGRLADRILFIESDARYVKRG